MWEASWAPVVKVLPRVSVRNAAALGTPMLGAGGQDLAREGGPPARASTWAVMSALCVCRAMSWRARWGNAAPAASVPER